MHAVKDPESRDVLGAGRGWAATILHNPRVRAEFEKTFAQVQEAAAYRETFRAEEREEEAKNSKKPSAGGSTTPPETRKAS